MARADRRRGARARPAARPKGRRDVAQASYEDTMFFTRLRRHAKWMFVFLALIFGAGFVVFGVGANNSGTGIGDILRDGGSSGNGSVSVSEARKRVAEDPKDADAQLELVTALETDGRIDEAIAALNAYSKLRPKDATALRRLAGLYLTQGNTYQAEAQNAQIRAAYLSPGATFVEPLQLGKGGATLGEDPITTAITTETNEAINSAITKSQAAYSAVLTTSRKVVALNPNDPDAQVELAQAATQVRDYATAIAAYKRYLALAPDNTDAEIIKAQIAQLQAALDAPSSG
jgi:tetratricopeptide (TPR) repeat protein